VSAFLPPSFISLIQGALLIFSACPCGVGAGRRFSIISGVLGCEMEMDAWVGVCRWGSPSEI
ncbi:MAG: hypothetical protein MUO43_10380, partial [Desulfobacterales bacterium]|nr:hypothetical protein [Desulfobacterales bacterium]